MKVASMRVNLSSYRKVHKVPQGSILYRKVDDNYTATLFCYHKVNKNSRMFYFGTTKLADCTSNHVQICSLAEHMIK